MSVSPRNTYNGEHFEFVCDGGCRRASILACEMPRGWEALRGVDRRLLHRCADCRFAEFVPRVATKEAA